MYLLGILCLFSEMWRDVTPEIINNKIKHDIQFLNNILKFRFCSLQLS